MYQNKTFTFQSHFTRGLTLVELLVVIAIIAVLAAISFPIAARMKDSANTAVCVGNLKQVGTALISYAVDHNNQLPPLQGVDPVTKIRSDIWTLGLARAGYLWETPGVGPPPCGKGVWTCPSCDFMSDAFGGYGVAEDGVFAYQDSSPIGTSAKGSLRLTAIDDPANTWLVGDATQNASTPNRGWYGIWSQPGRWDSHGPGLRHKGKGNVCMVDGHVESLTLAEMKKRKLTENVVNR